MRAHLPADGNAAGRATAADLLDAEPHEPVVDHHLIARAEHLGEHGWGDGEVIAFGNSLPGDRHALAGHQESRAVEVADP